MLAPIDAFLNKITMYRLVLYFLTMLFVVSVIFSFFGWVGYSWISLVTSGIYFITVCYVLNTLFAKAFKAPTNIESVYITAFILILIVTPPQTGSFYDFFLNAFWISLFAIASKFLIAIKRKHIFNPAAFGAVVGAFVLGKGASWWIAVPSLAAFIVVGGLLIVRKIRRADLFVSYIATSFVLLVGYALMNSGGGNYADIVYTTLERTILFSPLIYFASVMLTEPLTTPPTSGLRIIYGVLVGIVSAPFFHIGNLYFSPELALLVGNIYVYAVSPRQKLLLTLKQKKEIARDTYEFWFSSPEKLKFNPGQYVEWTLAHPKPDSRGNRRYFTVASSPTEEGVSIGIKMYPEPSSFKKHLVSLNPGDTVVASQLAGDFMLPKNEQQKLVFIAGGIGITPFRSMVKYLVDKNEHRPITLLYSNRTPEDVAYKPLFDEAAEKIGLKTVYMITEKVADGTELPSNMNVGYIDKMLIEREVPDYKDRTFYLSGPHGMVVAFEKTLAELGVSRRQIKTDFFPGFA